MVGLNLFTANLGDSRAILISRRNSVFSCRGLSEDQKPENPVEKERIIKAGGRVEQYKDDRDGFIGPYRVWFKYEQMPGLAMSRSFGDKVASEVGKPMGERAEVRILHNTIYVDFIIFRLSNISNYIFQY
jgi:serine/threonine protein phosphatase PrpC